MWTTLVVTFALTMAEAPKLTEAEEQALTDGFIAGGMGELRLVDALRPLMHKQVRRRWPSLWPQMADLEQTGFLNLFQLRKDEETREQIRPTLVELVGKLLGTEAQRLLRPRRREAELTPKLVDAQSTAGSDGALLEAQWYGALIDELPKDQAEVIMHYVAEESGEGPPVHEALETTPKLARMRVAYARKLLFALANPEEEAAHG